MKGREKQKNGSCTHKETASKNTIVGVETTYKQKKKGCLVVWSKPG